MAARKSRDTYAVSLIFLLDRAGPEIHTKEFVLHPGQPL